MLGERITSQPEVIRAIVLQGQPVGVPYTTRGDQGHHVGGQSNKPQPEVIRAIVLEDSPMNHNPR